MRATKAYQRGSTPPICASAGAPRQGKLINATNFIENANANERDANICTNLIQLCFIPLPVEISSAKLLPFIRVCSQTTELEVMLLMSINQALRERDISDVRLG